MAARILVIEDQEDINDLIVVNLRNQGHEVTPCLNGRQGLETALAEKFDLILLDLMLPEIDGLQVCQTLRSKKCFTPVLMLTAKNTEVDRVLGLEMGADDYLTKPFSVLELQARVKALLRRMTQYAEPIEAPEAKDNDLLVFDELSIEKVKRIVQVGGQPLQLTAKEFDLLLYLASSPGQVFSRQQLLDAVWGYHHGSYEHTVNSHINRLRAKVEKDPAKPKFVLTVWGVGYKFDEG